MSLFTILSGNGANEGWHYIAWSVDDVPVDWTGMLYEGDLGPFGPLDSGLCVNCCVNCFSTIP